MTAANRRRSYSETADIERIDVAEFRERGYLHELNRRFLHPLGLALEVLRDADGNEQLGGIWDYRDDPEGINFHDPDPDKIAAIDAEWARREPARVAALGYMVQEP